MSDKETTFLRQLKITLISILLPFILTAAGLIISDHYKIKENQTMIRAVKDNYVSNDMLLRYVNEFQQANMLFASQLNTQSEDTKRRYEETTKRMDAIIRDIYVSQKRGEPISIR